MATTVALIRTTRSLMARIPGPERADRARSKATQRVLLLVHLLLTVHADQPASTTSRSGRVRWRRAECRSTPIWAEASASTSTMNGSITVTTVGAAEPQAKVRSNVPPVGRSSGTIGLAAALLSTVVDPAVTGWPSSSTAPGKASTSEVGADTVPVNPIASRSSVAFDLYFHHGLWPSRVG